VISFFWHGRTFLTCSALCVRKPSTSKLHSGLPGRWSPRLRSPLVIVSLDAWWRTLRCYSQWCILATIKMGLATRPHCRRADVHCQRRQVRPSLFSHSFFSSRALLRSRLCFPLQEASSTCPSRCILSTCYGTRTFDVRRPVSLDRTISQSGVFPPSHAPGAASTRRPSNHVTGDENATPRVDGGRPCRPYTRSFDTR
jgi:hypothetical protein